MAGKPWTAQARLLSASAQLVGQLIPGRWVDDAACTLEAGDLFIEKEGYAEAVEICHECPVQITCRRWAVTHDVRDGIYGGMGYEARKKWAGKA